MCRIAAEVALYITYASPHLLQSNTLLCVAQAANYRPGGPVAVAVDC